MSKERKPCSRCGNAKAVRPGLLCNACFSEQVMEKKQEVVQEIPLERVRLDGGTQPRSELNYEVANEYGEAMAAGAEFPPIRVVYDGSVYWPYDGFHRLRGRQDKTDHKTIPAIVVQGTVEDARWLSLGANRTHGLRREKGDVERAILRALELRPDASDGDIAEHVGVARGTVLNHRHRLEAAGQTEKSTKRTGRDGRTRSVGSSGGGRGKPGGGHPAEPSRPTHVVRDPDASDGYEEPTVKADADAEYDGDEAAGPGKAATVYDGIGVPITRPEALEAWRARADFDKALSLCRELAGLLDRLAVHPGGLHLRPQLHLKRAGNNPDGSERYAYRSTDLENLKRVLKFAEPFSVNCPRCLHELGHFDPQCKSCGGTGIVTKLLYDQAPEEYRREVEALAHVGTGTPDSAEHEAA